MAYICSLIKCEYHFKPVLSQWVLGFKKIENFLYNPYSP